MSTAEDDLREFAAFVQVRIARGEAEELGLAELFDLWMLENPTESDRVTNVAAIHASINDLMKGERVTSAGEHFQELRQNYGIRGEINAAIQEGFADVEAGRHRAADEVMDELGKKHGLRVK